MNRLPTRLIPALLPALILGGCASTPGEYPSLARRPAERVSGELQPAPAPPPSAPVDPATVRQLDSLLGRVRAADARFRAAEPGTRQRVLAAAGAAKASEAWSVATIALSSLSGTRSEAMVALADLDAIYAAGRIDGEPATEAKAARDAAAAIIADEERIITELSSRLAG